MSCLFEPNILGCAWGLLPGWAQLLLVGSLALFAVGVLWRLRDLGALVHRIAGWPGVAAFVVALGTLLAVVFVALRRSPPPTPIPAARPKRRDRPTIFDAFKPRGSR